jgi:hypothetical protein
MSRDDERLQPGLPVGIPRPTTTSTPADPLARRDGAIDDDDDPDGPLDWRISAAVVGLLWAAFTSLMLSVAPPTSGSLAAWGLATSIATGVVFSQWLGGLRATRSRALSATTRSAPRQALEERAPAGDVDGIEERLDEDPA